MINLASTISAKLDSISGVKSYAISAPINSPLPYVVYQSIASKRLLYAKGVLDAKRDRYQIRCVASSYGALKTLVGQVEALFTGNSTDFDVSMPTELQIESKPETGIYTSVRDYLFFYS